MKERPPAARPGASMLRMSEEWFRAGWGTALLAVAFVSLAAWSWGKWTDLQIDFGAELYLPWRITCGERLFEDIHYRHGPLSPYLNALWFRLFGVSLRTLVLCNLAILAAICAMTYRVFRLSCGRLTAATASLVLLCVFGFSQYTRAANYNFVTPYQHHQTHGTALSLGLILCLAEFVRRRDLRWAALAGGCLGAVFLTKAELMVAAAATAILGVVLAFLTENGGWIRRLRFLATLLGSALVPVAAAFAALSMRMPPRRAGLGILGNWAYLGRAVNDPFYRWGSGLEAPWEHLGTALSMFLGIALAVTAIVVIERLFPAVRGRAAASAAIGLAVFAVLWLASEHVPWKRIPRALPFTTLGAAIALWTTCLRHRADPEVLGRWAPLALWAVWASALLGKLGLFARVEHYGFVLAMPATLLLVACLAHFVPAGARTAGRDGTMARALALAVIAAGIVFHLGWSELLYARKTLAVGTDGDALLIEPAEIDPRQAAVWTTLEKLREEMPPDATLLALPEGLGLNYWLRKRNPSRYFLFLPPELAALGGDGPALEDIRAHPPDYVALLGRDSREFGVGPFGTDPRNGRRLVTWLSRNYRPVLRMGPDPFTGAESGSLILRRAGREPS